MNFLKVFSWLLLTVYLFPLNLKAKAELEKVVLWHAYRAEERAALEEWSKLYTEKNPGIQIKLLAIPYDAYGDKLKAAIPRGKGPDLFIGSHDSVSDWANGKYAEKIDGFLTASEESDLPPNLYEAFKYKGATYGLPLNFKSLAMMVNLNLMPKIPATFSELELLSAELKKDGIYGLVYENLDLYQHAALMYGFGGFIFGPDRKIRIDNSGVLNSVKYAKRLSTELGIVPKQVDGALVTALFNQEKAAAIFAGPWTVGEIKDSIPYKIVKMPSLGASADEGSLKPFLSVEGVYLSSFSSKKDIAKAAIKDLIIGDGAMIRLIKGRQLVSSKSAIEKGLLQLAQKLEELPEGDERKKVKKLKNGIEGFSSQLPDTVLIPRDPEMKLVWDPYGQMLGASISRSEDISASLKKAQQKIDRLIEKMKTKAAPVDYYIFYFLCLIGLIGIFFLIKKSESFKADASLLNEIKEKRHAYLYLAPAMLSVILLVFIPFFFGFGIGFYKHEWGNYDFVGVKNFLAILLGTDSQFFYTLMITVLWTFLNVFLHVSIGLFMALLLNQARLRFKTFYRILFILPWAIPSYITALIWKGMFHPEFGAVNSFLGTIGFAWMNETWSAFLANLITNTWLGFPFMMVIALGGLTSIPKDLYEAADIDGASKWHQFKNITIPLLKPVMVPAIILGSVWTFNMFNIIYLVSGGAPDGSTDILITEAYRWAFERGQGGAFGYASAYSTLIFFMLLGYSYATKKVSDAVSQGRA